MRAADALAPEGVPPRLRLYYSEDCPYAQRCRALLALLGQPFTPAPIDLRDKPPAFLALSPTGAVPLLEDGDLVLFESTVISEYLAETLGWAGALSPDPRERARERLVMKRFDDGLVPAFFSSVRRPAVLEASQGWRREVAALGEVARRRPAASLLGLHLAPHWLRMTWLAPENPLVAALRAAAGPYLDEAAALPAVIATSPQREAATRDLLARFGPASRAP